MSQVKRKMPMGRVIVAGGTNLDILGFPVGPLVPRVSNPGRVTLTCGGVGRNIAENLARLGTPVTLLSMVGKDINGERLVTQCREAGIEMDHVGWSLERPTSVYLALQERSGDMALAISQMDIADELTPAFFEERAAVLAEASLLVVEGNLPEESLEMLTTRYASIPVWFEPVSLAKCTRIRHGLGRLFAIKPNREEAARLSGHAAEDRTGVLENWRFFMRAGVREVWLSLGGEGLFFGNECAGFFARFPEVSLVNANGAGDALLAAAVHATRVGLNDEDRVRFSLAAAAVTCGAEETNHPALSEALVRNNMKEVSIYDRVS